MPLTKLGIAIENLSLVEQNQPWYEKAFTKVSGFLKSIFKKPEPSGLIHHYKQTKLFTDGKNFIASSKQRAREESNGRYFKTRFPHSLWKAKEKNSSREAKS